MKRRISKYFLINALTAIQFMLTSNVSGNLSTIFLEIYPSNSPSSTTTNNPVSTTTNSLTSASTKNYTSAPTNNPTSTTTKSPTSATSKSPTTAPTNNPTSITTNTPSSAITNSPTSTTTKGPNSTTTNTPASTATKSPVSTITQNWQATTTVNPTNSSLLDPTLMPFTTNTIGPVNTQNTTGAIKDRSNAPVLSTTNANATVITTESTTNTNATVVTTGSITNANDIVITTGSTTNITNNILTLTNGLVSTSSAGKTTPALSTTTSRLGTTTSRLGTTTSSLGTVTLSLAKNTPGLSTTTPGQMSAVLSLSTTPSPFGTLSSSISTKQAYMNSPEYLQSNAPLLTNTVSPNNVGLEHRYLLAVPHTSKDLEFFSNSYLYATLVMVTSETFTTSATVTLYEPAQAETKLLLQPGSEQVLNLTLTLENSGVSRRGVYILALGCLQLTLFTKITYFTDYNTWHLSSLSATHVLPHWMLYTDYVIVSYTSAGNTASNSLFIVSADDNNTVFIRFTQYLTSPTTAFTLNGTRVIRPESVLVTLPLAGQLTLASEGDLTGTRVSASRPVAVFISIIELTGDVSYEQLLPVIRSMTSFTSWNLRKSLQFGSATLATTPDSYTVASGATQVHFQIPQDNRTFTLSQPGDTYQFHLNQSVNITASQSFTGLKFLQHLDTTSRRFVDCIASLTAESLWRFQYFWAVPINFLPQNSMTSSVYVVVIIQAMYLNYLKLDGYYFKPDVTDTVLSSERYVVATKRVGSGYHTLSNDHSLFGLFVYGEANETKFCTTAGMNHMGHNFFNLEEFPVPGNNLKSDSQDYSVTSTTVSTNHDVTYDISQSSSNAGTPDVSTSPWVNTSSATTPPSQNQSVCPTLPQQVRVINMTSQDLVAILDEIRDELSMDATKLSSSVRKLVSIPDHRPSSIGMGLSGIVFIVSCFVVLMSGDVISVGRWLRTCCRHKK